MALSDVQLLRSWTHKWSISSDSKGLATFRIKIIISPPFQTITNPRAYHSSLCVLQLLRPRERQRNIQVENTKLLKRREVRLNNFIFSNCVSYISVTKSLTELRHIPMNSSRSQTVTKVMTWTLNLTDPFYLLSFLNSLYVISHGMCCPPQIPVTTNHTEMNNTSLNSSWSETVGKL